VPSSEAALQLEEDQIVEPLTERELEVALPSEKLSELRRKHPSGTGKFYVKADGEVLLLTTAGRQVPISGVRKQVSRALFEHRQQVAAGPQHQIDKRV
jgi:hypothetical protein